MLGQPPHSSAEKRLPRHPVPCGVIALCLLAAACDAPPPVRKPPPALSTVPSPVLASALAAARVDLAITRLATDARDEALVLLVSALEADPQSAEARVMAAEILGSTRWHLPELTLDHHLAVEQVGFAAPSSLWVSLCGPFNTTVRWNLESLKIESLLFPLPDATTRSLVFDPTHRAAVVERAGVTLLCRASTLKPIRDLGSLPPFINPSAAIVFSQDGLLLAHPCIPQDHPQSLVWHLRDAASGELIRSSETRTTEHPRPLAAFLDRNTLRVMHADGSILEMPVSPVAPVRTIPPTTPLRLLDAQFAVNGGTAMVLKDAGPHGRPDPFMISCGGKPDSSLESSELLERFPWSRHPGLWTGPWRDAPRPPLTLDDRTAHILTSKTSPVHAASTISALALGGGRIIVGETSGTLTIRRVLPLPLEKQPPPPAAPADGPSLAALGHLTEALTGMRYDEAARTLSNRSIEQRLLAFKDCDFDALRRLFPALDFSPLITQMRTHQSVTAAPESLVPLWDRLARADASGHSWPLLLEKSADLTSTLWHEDLTAAVLARTSRDPLPKASSPWLAPMEMERTFQSGDASAIGAAIAASGHKGPAAAKALELALASTHPDWIEACLRQASDLPPMLRNISISRIAWLQERKADALAGWADVFPDLAQTRLREDWDGWEQADFTKALDHLRLCASETFAAIDVPEHPTEGQRKTIAAHLNDPATMIAVGRTRFAKACLKAALIFAAFKNETATTFTLAARARELGENPAPCLRSEAMALTALGDYQNAHKRWIALITEHPVADQLPGDYAEASYTAFENSDPRQAMAILTTGLHRFPHDANFALRAGWVALLTGNAERAYRFLLTGQQIGYPEEKVENATALLAIAAQQTGAAEDAAAYYEDLILLDEAWQKPETLESLEWPEELKASLRQLVW